MKKTALFISALLMVSVAAAQPANTGGNPFNSFFGGVNDFVESLEVKVARAIGGPELKSKALANNANESLRQAERLSSQNRSEEASKKIEKYSRQMNMSLEAAGEANSSKLNSQLSNVSRKNIEVLEKVRDKVPEQAKQGIQKAIDNAEKARGKPVMGNSGQGREDTGKPSESGRPNISEKLNKRSGNTGEEAKKKINRTVEKGLEKVNGTNNSLENISGNGSDRVKEAVDNVSESLNESGVTESKPGENISGTQDGDEDIVEKGSEAAGKIVDETDGEGSGNGGRVGLP